MQAPNLTILGHTTVRVRKIVDDAIALPRTRRRAARTGRSNESNWREVLNEVQSCLAHKDMSA